MRHIRDTTYKLTRFLALGAIVAMGAACGDDDELQNNAIVRAVHIAQGAPEVTVYFNQGDAFTTLSFMSGSIYREIKPGTYRVDIVAAGASLENPTATVNITVDADTAYVLVIDGTADNVVVTLFQEPFNIPATENRVRLFNYARGTGPMTLFALPPGGSPAALTNPVAFGEASNSVLLPSGVQTVALDINSDGVLDAQYELPALGGGTLANLFAVLNAQNQVSLIVQLNKQTLVSINPTPIAAGDTTAARAINVTADAPSLQFTADGIQIAQSVGPLMTTNYTDITAGTYDVSIGLPGETPQAVIPNTTLGAGATTTIVAYGTASALMGRTIRDDLTGIPADQARVRVMHAAPGVGSVDVYDVSGATPVLLLENLSFGDVSDAFLVPLAPADIGVDTDDDGTPDIFFTTPAPEAQTNVNLYVAFNAEGAPVLLTQVGGVLASTPGTLTP